MTFLEPVVSLCRLLQNPGFVIGRGCSIVLGLIFLSLIGCGADEGAGPTVSRNPTPTGTTVSLIWDPVNDSTIIGYYIHYGTQSLNQRGSCAYDQDIFVSSPHGTVTDLEPGLTYYFAVSAYNGLESSCSNEVFTNT
jgi:Fibronectin type III domain